MKIERSEDWWIKKAKEEAKIMDNRNVNEGMDRNGVFFINVWRTIAATFIAFVAIVSIYSYTQNQLWYDSWNKCVAAGGQPIEDTVLGSDSRTFTCRGAVLVVHGK